MREPGKPGRPTSLWMVCESDAMSEIVGSHSPSVQEMAIGDELSLFDAATGTAIALNRTARDIWVLADGSSTVADVVATLAEAYQVGPTELEGDVRSTLEELTRAGVLVTAPT